MSMLPFTDEEPLPDPSTEVQRAVERRALRISDDEIRDKLITLVKEGEIWFSPLVFSARATQIREAAESLGLPIACLSEPVNLYGDAFFIKDSKGIFRTRALPWPPWNDGRVWTRERHSAYVRRWAHLFHMTPDEVQTYERRYKITPWDFD